MMIVYWCVYNPRRSNNDAWETAIVDLDDEIWGVGGPSIMCLNESHWLVPGTYQE